MSFIEFFGYIAAFLTSASFLPQAVMVIRTRQTEGLSLTMYSMFTAGVALWLTYGIMTGAWPIVIANLVTLVFAASILTIIVRNALAARRVKFA